MNTDNKLYLEAKIEIHEETAALKEKASSIIKLPEAKDKQPDLLYFSAIFVSSGENLNHAFFLGSELVHAEDTIINKALDVEHKESEIIGHIYDRAFMDHDGNPLNINEMAAESTEKLDKMDMHVAVAGILYKSRFPNLAEEVSNGQWKVSMEAYFQDFDIKIGDLIINKNDAEALGLTTEDGMFGKMAKVIKKGKQVAQGALTRVLRGIVFSGCGIVKHPANLPSVILETANEHNKDEVVLNYDQLEDNNKLTSVHIEDSNLTEGDKELKHKDKSELVYDDTVGICVSYKKEVHDSTFKGPGTKTLYSEWCALYELGCTSFSRDTTDPKCLRNRN